MSNASLTTRARIIDWLKTRPDGAGADEIAVAHGLMLRTVWQEMHLMRLEGVLELAPSDKPPSTKRGECRVHVLVDKRAQDRDRLARDPRFAAWAARS